jgi:hypothetical protein
MTTGPDDSNGGGTPLTPGGKLALALFSGAILASVVVMLAGSPIFKPKIGTVALTGLDEAGERAVTLRDGRVGFGFRVGSCSYAGPDYVVLDVDLVRDGRSVAHMRCRAFELEGDAGGGSGETHYNSDCQMAVPAGGATAVRAVASQEGAGRLTLNGASVLMYRP